MVTCPWCGTSYLEFQPNCRNCGGPLPPARRAESASPADEPPPAPPPAPRSISNRYAWRLMRSDGYAITGGIFAFLGFLFIVIGLPLVFAIVTIFVGLPFTLLGLGFLGVGVGLLVWRHQQALRIVRVLRDGQAAEGRILTLEMNPSVRVNNRHPWEIEYQYQVFGREYVDRITTLNTPGPQHQPGQPVWILYLPQTPENSSLYPHP